MVISRLREEKGFSFLEAVIGLVFLGIAFLATTAFQLTSIRGNSFSNRITTATYLAQDRLEYLRSLRSAANELTPGWHDDGEQTFRIPGTNKLMDLTFRRFYTVVQNGSLKTITYHVVWNDGKDHEIIIVTEQ